MKLDLAVLRPHSVVACLHRCVVHPRDALDFDASQGDAQRIIPNQRLCARENAVADQALLRRLLPGASAPSCELDRRRGRWE